MKKVTFLLIAFLATTFLAQAGLKRVGFAGNQLAGTDYTTLQLAHDAATTLAGDTIQVYPGSYSGLTQTKKLIIIGIGYFTAGTTFNANLNAMQANTAVLINNIIYNATSSAVTGSEYHGIKTKLILSGNLGTTINNISFIRCDMDNVYQTASATGSITNLKFKQCFDIGGVAASAGPVTLSVLIENCFFTTGFFDSNYWGSTSSFVLRNCTMSPISNYNFGNYNYFFENCLFGGNQVFSSPSNAVINNCIFQVAAPVGLVGTNNIFNANANNLFVGYPTQGSFSNDERWKLKAGSVAIGAGVGGVDCGMYGGTNPYKLSGIPATPAFYKLSAPSRTASANPYQITFSVRSNN